MAKGGETGFVEMLLGGLLFAVALAYVVSLFMKVKMEGFTVDVLNSIETYDNTKTYQPGALVNYQGTIYQLVEGVGQPGAAPDRPQNNPWRKLYDNTVIYKKGDKVVFKGVEYEMVETAGAAGFSPDRPGEQFWLMPYNPTKNYIVGDRVIAKGNKYVMIEVPPRLTPPTVKDADKYWKKF